MTSPTPKCITCQNEIPIGKYYELYKENDKVGDYCSPCWSKEQTGYEPDIKKGLLKLVETERERASALNQSLSKVPRETAEW